MVIGAVFGAVFGAMPGYADALHPPSDSSYRLNPSESSAYRLDSGIGRERDAVSRNRLSGRPFANAVWKASRNAHLDPALVHALIAVESGYRPSARSPKGAIGLMQVLPATALRYGISDPGRSPEVNLRVGTRYLDDLLTRFDDDLELALAAYNAGENAVLERGNRVPPYPETRQYVKAVLARYRALRSIPGQVQQPARIEYLPGTRLSLEPDRTN